MRHNPEIDRDVSHRLEEIAAEIDHDGFDAAKALVRKAEHRFQRFHSGHSLQQNRQLRCL